MPGSTFVACLTAAGHSEIIFAWLRPEMLASNVLPAGVPHRPNGHVAVGTRVHKTPWSRETQRVLSFSGKVGLLQVHTPSKLVFKIGKELLNLALAGLMYDSRMECELQFEMVLGAAEERKKSERSTTSTKCIMSQQRSNNPRNEGERWRCVGQREKLDVRKREQENIRVFRDKVNVLFKGACGHATTSFGVRCPWLFGSSLSSSRSTTAMEMLYFGSIPLSRGVALKAWPSRRCSLFLSHLHAERSADVETQH